MGVFLSKFLCPVQSGRISNYHRIGRNVRVQNAEFVENVQVELLWWGALMQVWWVQEVEIGRFEL
jgi:hypothetical protein